MMSSGEFCPECGDPVPSNPIDDTEHPRDSRLCNSCYIERYDLIDAPEKLEITVCAHCGAIYRDGTWEDVNANDYTEVAIEAVTDMLGIHVNAAEVDWQIAPEQVDQTTIRLHCHVTGTLRDTRLTEEVTVPVKIAKGTCSRCGRIAGDYYASTIQLRALDRDPTDSEIERTKEIANKIVAEREQAGDRDAFITDIAEVTGGLDIRVSTTQLGQVIANQVVQEFGGSVSDSETLVTEDEDGNEVYRVTYAVRLPPYMPGDIIQVDNDSPILVTSVSETVGGIRLTNGNEYETDHTTGINPDATKIGHRDDAQETTLVSIEDEHAVQVLDPDTHETKTIARPSFLDPDTNRIQVIKTRSGLHILPE